MRVGPSGGASPAVRALLVVSALLGPLASPDLDVAVAQSGCSRVAAPDGSDSNPGSELLPYRSVQKLVASLAAGETGCLREGYYGGADVSISKPDVTLRSYPAEHATVTAFLEVAKEAPRARVQGLHFESRNNGNAVGVKLQADDSVFSDNELTKGGGGTCLLAGSSNAAQRVVIERNRIFNCGPPYRETDTSRNQSDHQIQLQGTRNAVVRWNILVGNTGGWGVRLYPDADGTIVEHNVIDTNLGGVLFAGAPGQGTSDTNEVRYNAITYSAPNWNVEGSWSGGSPGSGNTAHDNCLYTTGPSAPAGVGTQSGFAASSNTVLAGDPYRDRSRGDYRFSGGSACAALVEDVATVGRPPDEDCYAKEGPLNATWQNQWAASPQSSNCAQIELSGTRIGARGWDGACRVKDGPISALWTTVWSSDCAQIELSGNRIGVRSWDGVCRVKEGALNATWVVVRSSGCAELALDGNRVGVRGAESGRPCLVKEGALTQAWVTERWDCSEIALAGNRIGVRTTEAGSPCYVKEGSLFVAWVTVRTNCAQIELGGPHVGVRTTEATKPCYAKVGLQDAWVTERTDCTDIALGGNRIGAVTSDAICFVKDGLNGAFDNVRRACTRVDVTSNRIAVGTLRSGPLVTASDVLWDRRNRPGDNSNEGAYDEESPLHVVATEGMSAREGSNLFGVKSVEILLDGERQAYKEDPCLGGQCPDRLELDWTLDADSVDDGNHTLTVLAQEGVYHERTVKEWTIRVDNTPPTVSLSGPLKDREGQDLPPGSYELNVEAEDGNPNGPDSARRSGVRSVEILVDGDTVDYAEQDCATDSCPMSRTFTFDTERYPGGEHTVEVIAEDRVGHDTRQGFQVTTACCMDPPSTWASSALLQDVTFGDVNGDDLDDLVGRNRVTQELMVGLSTGSRFDGPAPWGRWTALDPISHLIVRDVTGDGVEDLVGRDPVSNDVLVAASTGSSFDAPTRWTSWPADRELDLADTDGDGVTDLAGRHATTGELRVARSNGAAFVDESQWGSFDTAYEIKFDDVDGDGSEDVVGRNRQTGDVRVGASTDESFSAAAPWGSVSSSAEWAIGDGNDDGRGDLFARDRVSGDMRVARSTGSGFAPAIAWGNLPPQYTLDVADANGDAETDVAGLLPLTGEVRFALANVAAPLPSIPDYVPESGVVHESEDPLEPVADEPDLPPDDPVPVVDASASARGPARTVLGYQDQRRLYERRVLDPLTQPHAGAAPVACPVGDNRCTDGDNKIRAIYSRLQQAGVTLIRFNISQCEFNNSCADDPNANRARADRAIELAREQGFRVYLTLTGPAEQPSVAAYRQFVYDAVTHYQPLGVGTYSIWNEPNASGALHADSAAARADLYRSLYAAGYNGAKQASKDLNLKAAKVLIGELSSYKTRYTADRFLRAVAAPGQLKTDGVAWHPYSNRVQAEPSNTRGIEQVGAIQTAIERLWTERDANGKRLLVTPKGRRPALLFTEFGYLNLPSKGIRSGKRDNKGIRSGKRGNNYWHTEGRRAGLFRRALRLAYDPRSSSDRTIRPARWMVLYQTTEVLPDELALGGNPRYGQEYGVMSRLAEVKGRRPYGKDTKARTAADYRNFDEPQDRRAYCAIRSWAAGNGYPVAPNECG